MKSLMVVGGVYDEQGGRPSGYVAKLVAALQARLGVMFVDQCNGGSWADLNGILGYLHMHEVLLWGADVSNDYPKLLPDILDRNRHIKLIQTKNNRAGKYTREELLARMAASGAAYLLEFTNVDQSIAGTLLGADGTLYCEREVDIQKIADAIVGVL